MADLFLSRVVSVLIMTFTTKDTAEFMIELSTVSRIIYISSGLVAGGTVALYILSFLGSRLLTNSGTPFPLLLGHVYRKDVLTSIAPSLKHLHST